MKKKYLIPIIILIFLLSVAVHYWPVYHKSFSYDFAVDSLILARNLNLNGEYKMFNSEDVILSSEIIAEKGIVNKTSNELTPILYKLLFKIFGFNKNIPLFASLFIYGIISVLLFCLVFKLFNIKIALIFSFLEILSPLVSKEAINVGTYEWAILFLAIALLIYFWKEKPTLIKLFLAGILMAIASLARNSFLIIPIAFALYELIKNKSFKKAFILILPLIIVWSVYLGPGMLKGSTDNIYLSSSDNTVGAYMHIFPDPYTWHFERDEYVKNVMDSDAYNYDYSQFLGKYGYAVGLKNKILMYWASIISYPKGFIAQTTFGGPIIVFLLILGAFYLYKNKKYLLEVFIFWGLLTYLFLIVAASNHWGHFITFQFPIFLMSALGTYWIIQFIMKQDIKKYLKYLFVGGFILALSIHLIQSTKWMFHEEYENSGMEQVMALIDVIYDNETILDKKTDIIAVGTQNRSSQILNWYTDYSFVYFDPTTISTLLKENKLKWAFDQFEVTKFIGYDYELEKQIIAATKIPSLDFDRLNQPTYQAN